jgi:hypothetical protein
MFPFRVSFISVYQFKLQVYVVVTGEVERLHSPDYSTSLSLNMTLAGEPNSHVRPAAWQHTQERMLRLHYPGHRAPCTPEWSTLGLQAASKCNNRILR